MIFVLGRKDLGTGVLRNRTNGGEGSSGAVVGAETKKKISKANSGKTHTEAQNKAKSERNSGEKNGNYGRTGALNPTSKAIIAIEPDGTQRHFGSGLEAARELEINRTSLRRYLKNGHVQTRGKSEGWQFLYENP